MSDWHTCDTTHCIAGWACIISKEAGELEKETSTYLAGRVYLGEEASSHFFDSDADARKYLKSILDR